MLELGVARRDAVWRLDPRRPVGILLAVEGEVLAPAGDVRVVALGSSVMRDALLPSVFEDAAGMSRGTMLNISLPNATPFDFVLLYRRNRELLASAKLILVGIEDWYFYEEPGVSERYHRWATLSDRMTDYEGSQRLPLLVSWAWQTYAARQAFAVDGLAAALRGERAEVIADDGRTKWRPEEREAGVDDFDLGPYEARLRERTWRDRQVRYLRELVRLADNDGVPLLIVRMPMRAAAFRLREKIDAAAEPRLQAVLAELQATATPESEGAASRPEPRGEASSLATPGSVATAPGYQSAASLALLDVPTGAAIGLGEGDFLDERHLGTRGAQTFSRYLAQWAAARYGLQ